MSQNYELRVSCLTANGDGINATVSVNARGLPSLDVFRVEVLIPRYEDGTIEYYEKEAMRKAADIISSVNCDINKAA
ncbi:MULTISPECIES: DUF1327 domain-containing protein [Hafnia]|uniref:Protein of uncharacterized function (DUF1327) n=2 Tax=Hafnia alvei TaxID=569 RepID=A0A377PKK4_HAFAL|nr:DUF1327 domain-containing protein [Hafnia alvei]KFC86241.1 uncharacterized DUF1327 family protein [Hafnia alvei ATCC 13337]MCV9380291.1 YdfR family protein [Hafnia alvei]MDX6844927.1 DUF1327 domain-containing protein [Hafnia alvei]RLR10631.1 DUF1327 domain-containing protein [Hafnia alvei ATCC 13337]TBM29536.1 DUF1327 domain-containing protein [Hafnia alvei]